MRDEREVLAFKGNWRERLTCAIANVESEATPDLTLLAAEHELGKTRWLLLHTLGVGCPGCCGEGTKTYGSTATWAGGAGGQALTDGACDKCWGTGRTDRTGIDGRKVRALQNEVEQLKQELNRTGIR